MQPFRMVTLLLTCDFKLTKLAVCALFVYTIAGSVEKVPKTTDAVQTYLCKQVFYTQAVSHQVYLTDSLTQFYKMTNSRGQLYLKSIE